MPRGSLRKTDMLAKVYKLKTELYEKDTSSSMTTGQTGQWYDGAHNSLDKVLDIINEYSQ
jgi:hypothetical protein